MRSLRGQRDSKAILDGGKMILVDSKGGLMRVRGVSGNLRRV